MDEQCLDWTVPERKSRERIDLFLSREMASVSRSQVQKWIKSGLVTVDDCSVKVNHLLHPRERIHVRIPKPEPSELQPETIPLNVAYEDEFLLVVDKPAGMVVHPAYGHARGTLVNALLGRGQPLSRENKPERPGIVHRLDKDTSGLLVVAKDNAVHRDLARQFGEKSARREYIALVWGRPRPASGTIVTNLSRHPKDRKRMAVAGTGKKAVTRFRVEKRYDFLSLLSLRLETGRTHQIRVHLAYIGHPVFGDPVYGGRTRPLSDLNRSQVALAVDLLNRLPRQALHAKTLGFTHPVTGNPMSFDSSLPDDMRSVLEILEFPNGSRF